MNTQFGSANPLGGTATFCQRADFYGDVKLHGGDFTVDGGNVLLDTGGLGTFTVTSDILGIGTARIDITLAGAIDITSAGVLALTSGGALTIAGGGWTNLDFDNREQMERVENRIKEKSS